MLMMLDHQAVQLKRLSVVFQAFLTQSAPVTQQGRVREAHGGRAWGECFKKVSVRVNYRKGSWIDTDTTVPSVIRSRPRLCISLKVSHCNNFAFPGCFSSKMAGSSPATFPEFFGVLIRPQSVSARIPPVCYTRTQLQLGQPLS